MSVIHTARAALLLGAIFALSGCAWINPNDFTFTDDAGPDAAGTDGCTPLECRTDQCGEVFDGCGGTVQCGHCGPGEVCDDGLCTCEAIDCSGRCGQVLDCEGGIIECGGCPDGQTCGGGGPNRCGDDPCTPLTCAEVECGSSFDGCSAVIDCGNTCAPPQTCGGGDTPNVCGCTPVTCASLGADCGTVADGCGDTIDCGSCTAPQSCGGGGTANVCGCTPATCEALGADCGSVADGCGGTIACGSCTAPQTCGGGGTANVCGCTPATCAELGAECGSVADGCGDTLDCGSCTAPQTCGGAGIPNVCGCTATTCEALSAECGSVSDGCGGTLDCGGCTAPQTCGGGGTANACGCTPVTCEELGVECGSISDGCGGTLDCGGCTAPRTCGGDGTPNVCACPRPSCDGVECGTVTNDCGVSISCGGCDDGLVCSMNECVSTQRNYAFVSPEPRTGALGGLAGADAACASWAADAGIPGTYRAILSTAFADASTRLGSARGWIRVDGRPVADRPEDLFADGPLAPLRLGPDGADYGESGVWSASNALGRYQTVGASSDCNGWTSAASAQHAWYGFSDTTAAWLDRGTSEPCNRELRIYCFQVDHYSPLHMSSFVETGLYMFVTSGDFDTSTGIAGADALCASEAAADPRLTGRPVRAFIAPEGGSAISRFTSSAIPIVRPDGLRIANSLSALGSQPALHPPVLRLDGTSETFRVFTGARSPTSPGTASTTCEGWRTSSSGTATIGFPNGSSLGDGWQRAWFGAQSDDCALRSGNLPIYCLQDL